MNRPVEIVVIGTSLGGLRALETILSAMPADFPKPIAVVQHRSKLSDDLLRSLLQSYSLLRIEEPEDKQPIEAGRVYLAPPDYHLLVSRGRLSLSTEAPVSYARPSIDVLFESAALAYGPGVLAVVLTGANADGAAGTVAVKGRGGRVLVQDPGEADSDVMPLASMRAAAVDEVLTLSRIPGRLVELCKG